LGQEKVCNRWLIVLGAVIIQLCLGAVYAWSLFNTPLVGKFGWEKSSVVLTFSITIFVFSIFTIIAGKIQDKIGPRWVATGGGILLGLGLLLASQATSLNQLYIFYGVIGGAGIGCAYVCPLATCLKWFPDMRGLISGIAVAGFGAGALVFKPLILKFLGSVGVSTTFLYLGIIYLVAVVLGAQLLAVPPSGYSPAGWILPKPGLEEDNEFSTGQMISTIQFYIIWVIYLFGCMAGLMVIGLATDIGMKLAKLDIAAAGNAVVVIALFNAAGRIIWGILSDKYGRVNSLLTMYVLTALAMFGLYTMEITYMSFLILCSLIGFCFGGFLAIFPSLTADYYGTKNVGMNYGIVFLAYGIAAIIGPKIGTSVEFTQAFLFAAVLCIIGALLTFLIRKPPQLGEGKNISG
jgi:OFA family oxalate/formate antiporter-like MFS transporter